MLDLDLTSVLIDLGIFIIVILSMNLPNYLARKRRKNLENLAISLGFKFEPEAEDLINLKTDYSQYLDKYKQAYKDDPVHLKEVLSLYKSVAKASFDLEFTGIEIFLIGDSMEASNMIAVPFLGEKIYFFDYTYTIRSTKHSSQYKLTVALFKSKNNIPSFSLRPEHFTDKVSSFFGYKDINFDSYPEFSKRYYLKGDNEVNVKSFFSDSKISFLEQNSGWTIFGSRRFICLYKKNGYISPKGYITFIEEAKALLKVLIG